MRAFDDALTATAIHRRCHQLLNSVWRWSVKRYDNSETYCEKWDNDASVQGCDGGHVDGTRPRSLVHLYWVVGDMADT